MAIGIGLIGLKNSYLGIQGFTGIVLGLFSIIASIIFLFIGNGLWKGKTWARIIAIIFSIIGILIIIDEIFLRINFPLIKYRIVYAIILLLINLIIIIYLIVSKNIQSNQS